jgi:hypothetical protein
MDLIIPNTNKPVTGSFPTAPRKVRHWISELYPVTSASSTRVLLRGLKHCNRLENSARNRFEILEHFRPVVGDIIEFASGRYLGQHLPLNTKEFNAFGMVDTLLRELAFGYKLVVNECINNSGPIISKVRKHAIITALDLLNELALRHIQIYQSIPNELWQDSNKLYSLAEDLDIHKKPLGKEVNISSSAQTIEQLFTCIHLLSLAQSNNLRRGQASQLTLFTANNCHSVSIAAPNSSEGNDPHYFGLNLHSDAPLSELRFLDKSELASIRVINLLPFIEAIETEIDRSPNSVSALYEADVLTRASLINFKTALKHKPNRKHIRQYCAHQINCLLGLKEIYASIEHTNNKTSSPVVKAKELSLTLESLPAGSHANKHNDFISHPSRDQSNRKSTWDDNIAKTGVALSKDLTNFDDTLSALPYKGDWILCNKSRGGIGLKWSGDISPQATVGELVACQDGDEWLIGVVRWLHINNEKTLEGGFKYLAKKASPVLVERTRGGRNTVTTKTECLLASSLEPEHLACIFVPAYIFSSGEIINVRNENEIIHYKLLEKLNSTGSFTLFSIEEAGSSLTSKGLEQRELEKFGL